MIDSTIRLQHVYRTNGWSGPVYEALLRTSCSANGLSGHNVWRPCQSRRRTFNYCFSCGAPRRLCIRLADYARLWIRCATLKRKYRWARGPETPFKRDGRCGVAGENGFRWDRFAHLSYDRCVRELTKCVAKDAYGPSALAEPPPRAAPPGRAGVRRRLSRVPLVTERSGFISLQHKVLKGHSCGRARLEPTATPPVPYFRTFTAAASKIAARVKNSTVTQN
ncbi:hypothetical protein EVAR_76290_1 [Eumeta japonica]|uniref:Uncharacterized protein n=1 Tax=Eumeta variegata TaxID=151549 RepID=A0A4C1UP40_EUMVA|nr:hypothetical protein EVAR_76290_1 [Eumeta japonica]